MSIDIKRIDIKRIDIKEFRDLGYLQEVNRQFFHPLGLALEIVIEDCHHPGVEEGSFPADRCSLCDEDGKTYRLGGLWDSREDPEGFLFGEPLDEDRIAFVRAEREKRSGRREELLAPGRVIQEPQDKIGPEETS